MKLKIHVTAEDIVKGRREHGTQCPVARAVRRVAREASGLQTLDVLASYDVINLKETSCDTLFKPDWLGGGPNPKSVQRFIAKFDGEGRKAVKPFSFSLDV